MFKWDLALHCIIYVSLSSYSLTKTIKSGYRNYIIMPHVLNSFKHQCQQLFQVTNARLYFASISCLRRRNAETCCLLFSIKYWENLVSYLSRPLVSDKYLGTTCLCFLRSLSLHYWLPQAISVLDLKMGILVLTSFEKYYHLTFY